MRFALSILALALSLAPLACFEPVAYDPWHRHRDAAGPEHDGGGGATDGATATDGGGGRADSGPGPDAHFAVPDGSLRADAAVHGPDGGVCPGSWTSEVRTIEKIELVDGLSHYGATDRLRVTMAAKTGCESPGRVDVSVMSGNATDFVDLTAHAWVASFVCASGPMTTLVEIPGRQQGNFNVGVADSQNLSGPAGIGYQRKPCSGTTSCQCGPNQLPGTVARGGTCRTDCSCQTGLSCIGGFGFAGEYWSCERSCIDSTSCPTGESCLAQVVDSAPNVCVPMIGCVQSDCPPGFACEAGACADQRMPGMAKTCTCDADCSAGQHCTVSTRPTPTCEVWCAENRQCPGGDQSWFVCGTPSVCVPLD